MSAAYHPLLKSVHENIRAEVREFSENIIRPLAGRLEQVGEFSVELTRKMGDMGLLGIFIPIEYGGRGLDVLSYIIAVEEISRIDGSQAATVAAHNSLGLAPIYQYGTVEQKKEYLPMLTRGDKLWAFGLTEAGAGSDALNVETKAIQSGSTYILNGSKVFITNSSSPMASGVNLLAITGIQNDRKELSVFLVSRDLSGYSTEKIDNKLMWRAADTGKIFLRDVHIDASKLLGVRGEGHKMMLETLDSGRLSIAAMGLGLAQGAYECALAYSRDRVQFGKPIIRHQAIAFKLAEMATKIELARNTLYNTCVLKEQGRPFSTQAAISKLYCSEIAKEVADAAVQIYGAYGLVAGNEVERFYRDQRILQIGEGTSEILKLVISRNIDNKSFVL